MSWLDCLCCLRRPVVSFVDPVAPPSVTRNTVVHPSALDDKIKAAKEKMEKEREPTPAPGPTKFDAQKANVAAKRHRRLVSTEVVSVNTMFKVAKDKDGEDG